MTTKKTQARSGTSGDVWERLARTGYGVSGVLHVVLGIMIVRIGFGSGEEADQSNALGSLGDNAFGAVVLWVAAVAFLALGLWQAADALRGGAQASDRAKSAGKAGVYAALAFTSASIAMGSGGSNGDQQAQGFAATLMEAPAGRILVGAIGVGIVVTGVYHVVKGAKRKFLEDLRALPSGTAGTAVTRVGMVGYIAKGVALAVVGVLFVSAAVTADSSEAQGIDGAVETLLGLPGGQVIVILVGLGFAAYGVYSFARARYARM